MIHPDSWSENFLRRCRELAERPVFLVLVLLAANAVARPYAGIEHDARLYSIQVLNQVEHGAFNNDLFFRYGSQDKYSLFSLMMVPLVKALELKLVFFLVYLASNTLFIVGLVRLVSRLLDDGFLRLLSLVYLVVAPLNYGGLYTFHVHEDFLTPRLPAAGLVLLGLADLLEERPAYLRSLLFMALAGLIHPLMATGGFLIWAGAWLVDRLGWRRTAVAALTLGIACAGFLAVPSLAHPVLGDMDDVWHDVVLVPSAFNFASEWEIRDWANVLVSGVAIVAGLVIFAYPSSTRERGSRESLAYVSGSDMKQADLRIRLVAVVGLVGVAAVAGTLLAEYTRYALLLQGQPYRALWILKVFQVPLCFLLADRLLRSQQDSLRLLGFLPLLFLLGNDYTSRFFTVCFIPSTLLLVRGMGPQPRRPDWLMRVLPWAMLQGELAGCIYHEVAFVRDWNARLNYNDVFVLIHVVLDLVGILPWMIVIFAAIYWLVQRGITRYALCLAGGIFLAVQTSFFVLPNTSYAQAHSPNMPDILFARDFLQQRQPGPGKMPTVYSEYGRVDYVWLELGANSYYDWWQMSGFIFRRQTAMEGQRRAVAVGPFEVRRYRQMVNFERIKQFFQADPDAPAPTVADLARMCADPELDYAILKHEFPGLCSATNGRVYVYDCQKVRDQLKLSNPAPQTGLAVGQSARPEDPSGAVSVTIPKRKTPHDPS